jgi:hypothetical protein
VPVYNLKTTGLYNKEIEYSRIRTVHIRFKNNDGGNLLSRITITTRVGKGWDNESPQLQQHSCLTPFFSSCRAKNLAYTEPGEKSWFQKPKIDSRLQGVIFIAGNRPLASQNPFLFSRIDS